MGIYKPNPYQEMKDEQMLRSLYGNENWMNYDVIHFSSADPCQGCGRAKKKDYNYCKKSCSVFPYLNTLDYQIVSNNVEIKGILRNWKLDGVNKI